MTGTRTLSGVTSQPFIVKEQNKVSVITPGLSHQEFPQPLHQDKGPLPLLHPRGLVLQQPKQGQGVPQLRRQNSPTP